MSTFILILFQLCGKENVLDRGVYANIRPHCIGRRKRADRGATGPAHADHACNLKMANFSLKVRKQKDAQYPSFLKKKKKDGLDCFWRRRSSNNNN